MPEAVPLLGFGDKIRSYQAGTSELHGLVREILQVGTPQFYPSSPYHAVAKLYIYWFTVNCGAIYGMHACSRFLFNQEISRHGETFVTRKNTCELANIAQGLETCLCMGNLDALRDWGDARGYAQMQCMLMRQTQPQEFVIATGVQHSMRDFIRWTAAEKGVTPCFEGDGIDERGIVHTVVGDKAPPLERDDRIMAIDLRLFRPAEVETQLGDSARAQQRLGWIPQVAAQKMCAEMVAEDLKVAKRTALLRHRGDNITIPREGN